MSPVAVAVVHGELEPYGPDAQLTFVIATGACTVTVGAPMGTFHSVPIAFQTSSSWSVKPFSAPRTRYVISYECWPVIVRSGSPILMRS